MINFLKSLMYPSHELDGSIQIVGIITFAWALFQGAQWQWWAGAAVMYFLYYSVGMSVGLHRYYTHRQFKAPAWAEWLMLTCATLGGQSSPASWIHQHRLHHKGSDTGNDPHWFKKHGWKMLLVWFYPRYRFSGLAIRTYLRDPKIRFIHRHHNAILAAWLITLALVGGWWAVAFFWLIPCAWTTFASLCLVTVAHARIPGNYRNYNTRDDSQNSLILGYLTFGEGWHNNHHKGAGQSNFGVRWWELDVGRWVVALLKKRRR